MCTLAFTGPGCPFGSHCIDCCFVSGVWKETADSSMVTILSSSNMEWQRTIVKKSSLVLTRSFFISSVRSFGTHLADFFVRFRSCLRVRLMVLLETPWALASLFRITHLSFSMSTATSAINSGVLFFRLELLWRCRFSICNFLQDVVDLCPFNRLVAIRVFFFTVS